MVTWVIQTNLIDEEQTSTVALAAMNAGAKVIAAKVIPFVDDIQMESIPEDNAVIPYGSTKLSRLADKHNWTGMFFDRQLFSVPAWLANSDEMLIELYNSESYGTKVSPRNGYALGKKWLNVFVTYWRQDISTGHLFKHELYEDGKFPHWWLDNVLRGL